MDETKLCKPLTEEEIDKIHQDIHCNIPIIKLNLSGELLDRFKKYHNEWLKNDELLKNL